MARLSHRVLSRPALVLGAFVWVAAGAAAQDAATSAVLPPVRLANKQVKRLIVKAPAPPYPPLARLNYIQGHVKVEILISPQGRVEQAHVLKGHAFLAAAALRAVQKWKFQPYRLASQPRAVVSVVDVDFMLSHITGGSLPPTPEADLEKQVSPPRLLRKNAALGNSVPMRVLVGKSGDVLDSMPEGASLTASQRARQAVQSLKFRPAHWGTLPVPWYVQVRVPVGREDRTH
jgi:TonB family protein